MDVCSIAARSDAAALRVTVDSLLRAHPDATVHVLDLGGCCTGWDDVHLLTAGDIGVPDAELHSAAMLATGPSLRDWLLPRLLLHFAAAGTPVVHLSPGMRVLGPLDDLQACAAADGLGVVARRRDLPEDDELSPSPDDLGAAGPFHDDVLAAGPAARGVLDSWIRLSDPGRATPWQTVVATQGHGILGPATVISRWNVDSTTVVADTDGAWTLDGEPAVLADLTTFDPERPWLFSTLGVDTARTRLSAHPALLRLCEQHTRDLLAAEPADHADEDAFDRTADGILVHEPLRRAFRDAVELWRGGDAPLPPDPFDPDRPAAFTAWLDEVVSTDDVPLTRYLRALYDVRPDLRARFPHVPGSDAPLLVDWAERHARHEGDYSEQLVEAAVAAARSAGRGPARSPRAARLRVTRRPGSRRAAGVNVVGYLHGELGIGESARLMLAALRTTRVPYATISVDRHLQSRQHADLGTLGGAAQSFDMTLLCVNADQTGAVLEAEPSLVASSYRIGMWYWEAEEFPATMHGGFGHVDEVWTASDFVRDAVQPHTSLPVVTMTPPLTRRMAPTALTRSDLGLPADRPVLLFVFDYLSTAERKNPIGLIDAFRRAFVPDEGPVLVLKSINADKRVGDAERVRLRAAHEPDVLLMDGYLSPDARDALMQHCTAYVSLHRSEGLGLTLAEAMALGKPVVATAYSGNMQFMTEQNSFLVPWRPTTVPENCEPYPAGSRWAEPDLDEAARLMRLVLADPALAAARGARAAFDLREQHSPERAGRAMADRLTAIHRDLPRIRWRSRARRVRDLVRLPR